MYIHLVYIRFKTERENMMYIAVSVLAQPSVGMISI